MNRRMFLTAVCAAGLGLPALAEDWPVGTVQLTAAQIETLLSGNTTVGAWSGTGYRQYFADNGLTIYLAAGSPPDQGKWRVNTGTNQYESWWRNADWAGYTIVMTNGGYAWVNGDTLETFEIVEGRQLGD
ncbi:hypothetical protein [Roseovarius sp. 2305UL8-3]|uniref:hypothetical protein n=1 Tax=Roseovarius conchicola TaxID=3121636 RepID=UPI003529BA53